MYRNFVWLVIVAMAGFAQANTPEPGRLTQPTLQPQQQQASAAHLTARLIQEHHYRPIVLDDALSEKSFNAYLKSLDPERLFFIQSDVDSLKEARTKLDDAILNDNLQLPFAIFNRYVSKATERYNYARSLLKSGFDFQQKESYQYYRENEPWVKSEDELRDMWRKRVKNDWLQLKLAGKDDKQIVETLDKRYENYLKRMSKLKSEDAFQIFMNAYTMSVDPHTNYMGPRSTEDFDISMRLSLVGIGAVLEEKDDYATIKELVAGSPAALSEQLKAGDRIAGVAQGEKGAMSDVVGWRLDDTVALIRGTENTVVVLDIVPAGASPDSEHKRVTLIRKKIRLEDQAAKKSIMTVGEGKQYRVGVVALPGFYEDFQARQRGEADYRSATKDVSRLLEELKTEKVDAVLIDLRNNGGGSLTEAIELSSLFLGAGPVVQQRDAHGKVTVNRGVAPGAVWSGPMGVLINRASASASEIFAAAIQDYGRGPVIGETSYGKGTVQTMINLDQMRRDESAQLGDLKLTIAQFFRINGGTTQLRGVTPDIDLPAISDIEHFGESSFENGLPWMHIKAAEYNPVADLHPMLPALKQRHNQRVAKNADYQYLLEDIADYEKRRKDKFVSLNEVERRTERKAQEEKLKAREKTEAPSAETDKTKAKPGETEAKAAVANPTAVAAKDNKDDDDDTFEARRKKAKDALLIEAAAIVADTLELQAEHDGLATSKSPSNSVRSPKHRVQ